MSRKPGRSYRLRVDAINRIYDRYARSGLSNREIFRRHIYPTFGICERTFYNIMNATAGENAPVVAPDMPSLFDFTDDSDNRHSEP